MKLKLVILFWSFIVAAPVAAMEVKNHFFAPADVTTKALVLLSTSADRTPFAAASALWVRRIIYKGKKQRRTSKHVWTMVVNGSMTESHSPTEHMNVRWLALDPGEYLVYEGYLGYGCLKRYNNFSFTVAAGETLYLGEFRMEAGDLLVRDSYARDFEFFTKNSKGEKPSQFVPAIPTLTMNDNGSCTGF
jgi:hypothetical protein